MESEVGRVIWETIKNLGIVSEDRQEISLKLIKKMELRDKEGKNIEM